MLESLAFFESNTVLVFNHYYLSQQNQKDEPNEFFLNG